MYAIVVVLDDVGTAGLFAGVAAFDAGEGNEVGVLLPVAVMTGGTGTFTGGT